MVELLDRRELKERAAALLDTARVSAKRMTALYMALLFALSLIASFGSGAGLPSIFLAVLTSLLSLVLDAGFVLYCMTVRQRKEAEYLILFDSFGMVGKLIALELLKWLFIFLWAMLFVIPGLVAAYRYRFALYNLLEDPELGVFEALDMSKQQTKGYKWQLFILDASYFGWFFLASLPSYFYRQMLSARVEQAMVSAWFSIDDLWSAYNAAYASVDKTVLGIPPVVWSVIIPLWALGVALFYLPHYHCVQLDYFDAAKRTSGVGISPEPSVFAPFSQKGELYDSKGERVMKKYVCDPCGYVYDPAEGDPDNGVAPGTAFEDLPDDWSCPICGAGKDEFKPEE